MISLYSGTPGSGKSVHAAKEIAIRLRRENAVVLGNFYFNTKAVKKGKGTYLYVPNHRLDPDRLLKFSRRLSRHLGRRLREGEVRIYIDEAQLLFNSREYASTSRRAWLSFFSQHRHYGFDIILMAQFDRMLDRQIRGLIEYEHVHSWAFCSAETYLCVLKNGTRSRKQSRPVSFLPANTSTGCTIRTIILIS